MKKNGLLIAILLFSFAGFAQQDAMFTQYMFNTTSVNPAYAGSRNILSATTIHRSQWVGFDGAPQTQTFFIDAPIFEENIGLGGSIINDRIGPVSATSINADFSYKIKITKKSKLAFGLKAGLNMIDINLNQLYVYDKTESIFNQSVDYRIMPNFGFGLYYFSEKYYAGFSVPKLLKNNFANSTLSNTITEAKQAKHYFIIAGATFKINDDLKLKPTTFVKITPNAPIQVDITPMAIYQDKFWGGLMYRTGDGMGLLLGMNVTEQLGVGYSFDWSLGNKTAVYNAGSHELMLRYDFILKAKPKVMSPRHF